MAECGEARVGWAGLGWAGLAGLEGVFSIFDYFRNPMLHTHWALVALLLLRPDSKLGFKLPHISLGRGNKE